jgi:hypothetical protein
MIQIFQKLNNAQQSSEARFKMVLGQVTNQAINGKKKMVLRNSMAVAFYCRLLSYGRPYSTIGCFTITWAKRTFGEVHGGVSQSGYTDDDQMTLMN